MPKNDKKKMTIRGDTFVLQHPGMRWVNEHEYKCTDADGNINPNQFLDGIFDHVVIKTPEGFEGVESFENSTHQQEFMDELRSFL